MYNTFVPHKEGSVVKKLKIGVIGTGSLAGLHIDAYRKNRNVEVAALCDSNLDRARQRAEELGIKQYYGDYHEMLEKADIDAVSVITWNNTHAPITIAALESGKHVLCEKPPALNSTEAIAMQNAAKKSGKLLMYGFVKRFLQSTNVLKDFIANGELGEIYYVKMGYLRRCGNPGGWFAKKELSGGGPLIDLGVHIIDLGMFLMGKPRPVSVFGSIDKKIGNRANIKGISWYRAADYDARGNDVEDFATAMIRFENGAVMHFETSWTMNIKEDTVYTEIFGNKGGAKLEPEFELYSEKYDYLVDIRPVLDKCPSDIERAFHAEIGHFTDCILNGTTCICPAEDGTTIMKIVDAIYESAMTGHAVNLV